MADGIIQVAPDSTGKKIDADELTVGANTVERQRITLADPATAEAIAKILNAAPTTEYGLVVRNIPSGIQTVTLGSRTGKAIIGKTRNLVTTAGTADQVILTYTVTSGKTLYLLGASVQVRLTTYATTATNFGTASLETPSGTKINTQLMAHAGVIWPPPSLLFPEPLPIDAGTVVRWVCTPSTTTSFTWQGNLWGWEV